MNTLSWLIYAADATNRISGLFIVGAIALLFGSLMLLMFGNMIRGDCLRSARASYHSEAEKADYLASAVSWGWHLGFWPKLAIPAAAALALLSTAIPSRDAIYMIAASEMGEKVVTTPEAKEMLGDLREVIAKQIKKLKDDK